MNVEDGEKEIKWEEMEGKEQESNKSTLKEEGEGTMWKGKWGQGRDGEREEDMMKRRWTGVARSYTNSYKDVTPLK